MRPRAHMLSSANAWSAHVMLTSKAGGLAMPPSALRSLGQALLTLGVDCILGPECKGIFARLPTTPALKTLHVFNT